jgi:hypothetical protein
MRDVLTEVNQKMQRVPSLMFAGAGTRRNGGKKTSPVYRVAVRAPLLTRDSISGRQ